MRRRIAFLVLALVLALHAPAMAQEKSGLARLDPAHSWLRPEGRDRGKPRPYDLELAISQPIPFRAFLIGSPPRLVVDFRELDFTGLNPAEFNGAETVPGFRWGRFRPGWSRLVAELPGPYALRSAVEVTGASGQPPTIRIRIEPVTPEEFAPRTVDGMSALWDTPDPAPVDQAIRRQDGRRPLRVTIDPGHGGIDPGAQVAGHTEAVMMLTFARELRESLMREGIEVALTRQDDRFVPLERRMTAARAAGADLLISLHADALPQGGAAGATIYTWDPGANDRAARELAMRHDRADLLAGLDLDGTDDEIAGVLMDMARTDTRPRSRAVGETLRRAFADAGIEMHKHPLRGAAFSVLKSPDIPSVLIELGFLTDERDRQNLIDPAWRARMAASITRAVVAWARDDAARARLLRQ